MSYNSSSFYLEGQPLCKASDMDIDTCSHASQDAKNLEVPSICVTCQLFADNKPLSLVRSTSCQLSDTRIVWNQCLNLSFQIADLPQTATLVFTILSFGSEAGTSVIGGSAMPLFDRDGSLRSGQQRLHIWRGVAGDNHIPTSTPFHIEPVGEAQELEDRFKELDRRSSPNAEWLDKLALRLIQLMRENEVERDDQLILTVELPKYDLPVVFSEQEPVSVTTSSHSAPLHDAPGRNVDASLFTINDPEGDKENLIEAKHRRLIRSQRSSLLDRERKPTATVRDELNAILLYPSTRPLSSAEKDLVWSFRFHLTRFPKALTKFLKSVVWSDSYETRQATEVLLPMWAEPELSDVLELLGPWFRDLRVRLYAVRLLRRASDDELELYLLQLVQVIKFDEVAWSAAKKSQLQRVNQGQSDSDTQSQDLIRNGPKLVELLCERSTSNKVLGTMFYWYIKVECGDTVYGTLFERVAGLLQKQLLKRNEPLAEMIKRQRDFVDLLSAKSKQLRLSRDGRPKKIEKLHALLADNKSGLNHFRPALSLPLDPDIYVSRTVPERSTIFKSNLFPLRIEFCIEDPCDAEMESTNHDHKTYTVICKDGDDLRQDQLVIQLFALMDKLLRNEKLDLKITPYRVLATSPTNGLVEFIPSMTIAAIVAEFNGSILNYLRAHYPDKDSQATYHVQSTVLDTFVRSCAGYCVITYLLEIGDRHLDNLLVSPDGHFFHVDFGYIFGHDPKPFPPPVKICKEMVEGLGGANSVYYARFKRLCSTAYACLRKNANLILNSVSLMVDANIPDIRSEPDKAVLKIQEKFLLDLSEEKAIAHFEALFNETSYISTMFDRLHNMAQYFRQ
ncbi:phosphatidylinositol 3-kinase [Malassezia yamatoensis]|uniref:Phosphatidylinositol 3-kinase VPS34 n=1 Tax=Malassezia yamatoensis TaxID=253288 RepID=A0AAJ5YQW4_9BASI|nr:phosphatidylinositol 3-kinase [Malassezia yamatoensis]